MISHLRVNKTARIVIEGSNNPKLKSAWLIAHGYGHLATYFINKFRKLFDESNLIIVPEGLHRYYLNGVSGRVGASWMTKEERENDIADYCSYLDKVYETYITPIGEKVIVNALGFSQGGSTICRWAAHTDHKINNLMVWGSSIPADMIPTTNGKEKCLNKLQQLNWFFITGNQDEFMDEEQHAEQLSGLEKNGIKPYTIIYQGGHDILEEPLILLNKIVLKNS